MFNKFGELLDITSANIQTTETVLAEISDHEINERFKKFAQQLKRIAPKADDFLYFSAIMMHAAEAAAINPDGSAKLMKNGEPVKVSWEISSSGSWKWVSSDPNLRPTKNANGDIFPESELLKAYKQWVGKPLCVDHKSDSVDAIRGIILDTYYDRINKRIVALAALDKVSYPDLARGITSGYKTSVSMGTAVAAAICYDCGNVARTERDFCQHMKQKTTYGEVNTGLTPIELSLVVNGADPNAKIRTILAAANHLRQDIDSKQNELHKLALEPDASTKFSELEDDLKKITEKLAELKTSLEKEDTNQANAPYGNTGDLAMKEPYDLPNTDQTLQFPARLASNNNALLSEMQELKTSIKDMEKSLLKIKEELTMTANNKDGMNKEAYFQGAGGVNEPAPHQVKYPKDPMNERLRNEDKHMVGQHNLNMGPVDGMHPGPDSAGMSDEQRKEMLHRAEVEQRAMRRAAALKQAKEKLMETKAYFQGGGGVNEPAPGKVKYPADPLNEKDRSKEDKQMVGQKPFPDVGDVEGLHPSPLSADEKDELVRKQKMNRAEDASLRAKFHRVAGLDGTQDFGKSGWQVFQDGQLVFTASVNEISGGNVNKLYDLIATKEFGTKLLEKIRTTGVEKTAAVYKSAQAVSGMGAQPAAPADMGGAAPIPPMADMGGAGIPQPGAPEPMAAPEASKPMGEDGDPKEVALKLATRMRDDASDLLEAVRVLTGEQAEMGELEGLTNKAASADLKQLMKMKKTLNAALIAGMKKTADALKEHHEELGLISDILSDNTVKTDYTNTIVEEALVDAKAVLADVSRLKEAFVKYAHGSEQLEKQAKDSQNGIQKAADMLMDNDMSYDADAEAVKEDEAALDMGMDDDMLAADVPADLLEEEEMEHKDENDVKVDLPGGKGMVDVPTGATVHAALDTKEARTEMRTKLAAQSVEFSDMLDQAHKLTDGQTQLDVKPSDNLGRVETIEERHAIMLDVAEAPPKVRKEAERLNQFIVQGKVSEKDLDKLVAQGLDPAVVKYWKQFYGEAGKEGSEFAAGMLKEHAKAQFDEVVSGHKVKLSRAYELTNEMVRRGLLTDDRIVIAKYVDDVMTWNDEGFEAMKRMIAKQPLKKSAAVLPQIGIVDSAEAVRSGATFQDALDSAFANRRY